MNNSCETCSLHNRANLEKLGIDSSNFDFVISLAGNPNTGKSTVFNNLTGLRQHTGNWPGKTVGRAEGAFVYNSKKYKIVDLPGTYSLLSTSTDEDVARNFILFGQPDVNVVVVDATRIERNLNLLLQVLEITDRVVVCLNLIDEAERNGIKINDRQLSKELGVPVIPASARQKVGMNELLQAIEDVCSGKYICKPNRAISFSKNVSDAIGEIMDDLSQLFPALPNKRWVAMRLLEGDQTIIDAVNSGDLGELKSVSDESVVKGEFV